jgi:hypothetical protein
MHGYVTHKHAVNPTGLDEEERAAHKVPLEAQKLSDTLAKEQGNVRARLVKLQLPANGHHRYQSHPKWEKYEAGIEGP